MEHTLYFTIATAGHVDHGKTSVLRALTGIDPDRLKEEKLRQMTTDLGFAHLKFSDASIILGFIDVPGHGKFLKNMLAGVGGIDMALLVVAGDEGPMPQTKAHVKILSLLGVTKALVVMTKIDISSEQQQETAEKKIDALLARYKVQKLELVKVACPSKQGFDALKASLKSVVSSQIARESNVDSLPLYVPIDRVFSKAGYGVVITGTLVRGTVSVGDAVFVEPGKLKSRVRGLETFGQQLQTARAGQRLAVNLSFREHTSLARGQSIVATEAEPNTSLIVNLIRTADAEDNKLDNVLPGQMVRLYHGTAECAGDVRWVETIATESGEIELVAQIAMNEPLVSEPGDRFVLRYGDDGIAGGIILSTARPRWLTRPKLLDLCARLLENDYPGAVAHFLDACPQRIVQTETLNMILPVEMRNQVVERMQADRLIVRLATFLATTASIEVLSKKLLDQLAKVSGNEHDTSKQGNLEAVRGKVMPGIDRSAFQAFVKDLSERGAIARTGDVLSLPKTQVSPKQKSEDSAKMEETITSILGQHLCLEIEELAKQCGRDAKHVTSVLNQMSKDGKAEVVNYEYASSIDTINGAHKKLAQIWQRRKEISPADFRDELGTTRKYAMALLAYFDDHGITRRVGNSRVLLKNPKAD